jgi:hypothetical protein
MIYGGKDKAPQEKNPIISPNVRGPQFTPTVAPQFNKPFPVQPTGQPSMSENFARAGMAQPQRQYDPKLALQMLQQKPQGY